MCEKLDDGPAFPDQEELDQLQEVLPEIMKEAVGKFFEFYRLHEADGNLTFDEYADNQDWLGM